MIPKIRFKLLHSQENTFQVFELLWNKGLILGGAIAGILYNPLWFLLIIPSLIYDLQITGGDE